MIVTLIEKVYSFLWGDLVQIPLPGGSTLGISLLIILLIPTGILFYGSDAFFCRFACSRIWCRHWLRRNKKKNSLSSFQTLIVSTATRVGMGIWSVLLRNFGRRRRCGFLDVGDGNYRFINSFY